MESGDRNIGSVINIKATSHREDLLQGGGGDIRGGSGKIESEKLVLKLLRWCYRTFKTETEVEW